MGQQSSQMQTGLGERRGRSEPDDQTSANKMRETKGACRIWLWSNRGAGNPLPAELGESLSSQEGLSWGGAVLKLLRVR